MVLTEENFIDKINSYSENDWSNLFELILEIEKNYKYANLIDAEENEEGSIKMSFPPEMEIISKFLKIVYEMPIIIAFNWGEWDEGKKIASDVKFDLDTIDTPTKCKLITAIVRNDRFCEGALDSAFESGLILNILKSIKRATVVRMK